MISIVLVTGASTGIGEQAVYALANAGHTVYASLRDIAGHNAAHARALLEAGQRHSQDIRVLELDVNAQASADRAVDQILEEQGRVDVVVHNAAQLGWGVLEAFSADAIFRLFDTNVLGAHRVNRAVLPHMRSREAGLLLYIGSTTSRMIYPFQGPYPATKAMIDAMAQTMRYEVAPFGIDVVILMPDAIMTGTQHFDKGITPADTGTTAAYERIARVGDQITQRLIELSPADADSSAVGAAIARVVALPAGTRPFRPMVDFLHDGAEELNEVAELMQARLMDRLGIGNMLRVNPTPGAVA